MGLLLFPSLSGPSSANASLCCSLLLSNCSCEVIISNTEGNCLPQGLNTHLALSRGALEPPSTCPFLLQPPENNTALFLTCDSSSQIQLFPTSLPDRIFQVVFLNNHSNSGLSCGRPTCALGWEDFIPQTQGLESKQSDELVEAL